MVNNTLKKKMEGLDYFPNAVTIELAERVEEWLQNQTNWEEVRKDFPDHRTVLQFGSKYLYDTHTAAPSNSAPNIPNELKELAMIVEQKVPCKFTQCIVNCYKPGQSIMPHCDLPVFGPIIACFTFGEDRIMTFTKDDLRTDVAVGCLSLYIMTKSARYQWKHEMLPQTRQKKTIYSVTFRQIPDMKSNLSVDI